MKNKLKSIATLIIIMIFCVGNSALAYAQSNSNDQYINALTANHPEKREVQIIKSIFERVTDELRPYAENANLNKPYDDIFCDYPLTAKYRDIFFDTPPCITYNDRLYTQGKSAYWSWNNIQKQGCYKSNV